MMRHLTTYPDVKAAAVDPVRHYLMHGWREGRFPSQDFDTGFYLEQLDTVPLDMEINTPPDIRSRSRPSCRWL